jgi:hypothetical protein
MSADVILFPTSNTSTSYTSTSVFSSMRGYRTGVFQANAYTGDTILLQGRLSADSPWVSILEVADQPTIVEVVLCREMRVQVTNNSTQATTAYITR